MPEKMAEQVQSQGVNVSREDYTMNWLGKSYARYLRHCPPNTLPAENTAHNNLPTNQHSQNLLIKGDNLEVLKHLEHAYKGEVKMIYIDPPYNTGSDGFVYQDERKFTPEQLAELADMSLEEAKRVLNFTAKKSNSHSAWLTFMYPRLYIAHRLLKNDGVMFISIDDNEQVQLRLLCDDVFGERNFISSFIRKTKTMTGDDNNGVNIQHEYLVAYAKNKNALKMFGEEKTLDEYSNPDNDPNGDWCSGDPSAKSGSESTYFPIKNPYTGIEDLPPKGRFWAFSKETMQKYIETGRIKFKEKYSTKHRGFIFKRYAEKLSTDYMPVGTLFTAENDYMNSVATSEINDIFSLAVFNYPKPSALLEKLIKYSTNKNDLILDFFAGSGTTAHAVMQLNAKDDGNRRFIMVQLPEETDKKSEAYKAGYKTIFDITKDRIEKSAVKIRQDFPDFKGDLGFKIFETTENFLAVSDDELNPKQSDLPETLARVFNDEEYRTLLTTWRLRDGNALTDNVQAVDLGSYTANLCGDNLYLLYPHLDSKHIKALLNKLDGDPTFLPKRIILFGANIDSAKQMELHQAMKTYSNKKNIELNIVVRY
ncbi:site-specific DNA-methyltransferase [Rodentibacter heidelbergensis]|uniref:site-specific DNA-methyltransferase n=1 Tax=Rodentibacter heidelbergensis TaxID=1908258 RepID=UPI001FCA15D9|nr:site-specific DNA-methyltransferase [Rodentibacter heidelbergensis]